MSALTITTRVRLLAARLFGRPSWPLIQWEAYEVAPGVVEAEGMPTYDAPHVWLHADTPGALLDLALATYPDVQHEVLVSHRQERHLCSAVEIR